MSLGSVCMSIYIHTINSPPCSFILKLLLKSSYVQASICKSISLRWVTVNEVCTMVASPPGRCDTSSGVVLLMMKSEGLLETRTGKSGMSGQNDLLHEKLN